MTEIHPSLVGTPEAGYFYNQGKCRKCGWALLGEIPAGTDLDTYEFETRDICGACVQTERVPNPLGRKRAAG